MAERYELEPHVRACVEANELIFLDLRRDRYWRAPIAAAPTIVGLVDGGSGAAGLTLSARGLIRPSEPGAHASDVSTFAGVKPRDALRLDMAAPALAHLAFVSACALASLILRTRRLDWLLWILARWKQRVRPSGRDLVRDAAAFDRLRAWWPAKRVCLFDSIALAFFLLGRGHAPDLVLGVRVGPFAAHCWVESDGVVICDTLEQCVAFTPIARV